MKGQKRHAWPWKDDLSGFTNRGLCKNGCGAIIRRVKAGDEVSFDSGASWRPYGKGPMPPCQPGVAGLPAQLARTYLKTEILAAVAFGVERHLDPGYADGSEPLALEIGEAIARGLQALRSAAGPEAVAAARERLRRLRR